MSNKHVNDTTIESVCPLSLFHPKRQLVDQLQGLCYYDLTEALHTHKHWSNNVPYTKEQIKQMLQTNDKAVARGVLAIYAYQTAVEQASEATQQDNGVGFNGADAKILSSFAKQLQRGWTLSTKQMTIARQRMLKYAGQLANIANAKAA